MDCPIQKFKCENVLIKTSKCLIEIENFRDYPEKRKVTSTKVHFLEFDAAWTIEITPNDGSGYTYFIFTIYLNVAYTGRSNNLQYRVLVTTGSDTIIQKTFKKVEREKICDINIVEWENLLTSLSKDGSLTVAMQVEFQYTVDPISVQKQHYSEKSKLQLVHQYSSLLNDATFSDFTFIVKGKTFKVHKNILASESEAMRAMLTNQFKESAAGECLVDDIDPNIFQIMLQFIYAGIIPKNLEDVAVDLFKAAHYYGVVKLLEICKENIHFGLSSHNALELYELSTMYDIEDVRLDAWKIVKSEFFNIYFPLNDEPLSLKDFHEICDLRTKTLEFWSKHKKAN